MRRATCTRGDCCMPSDTGEYVDAEEALATIAGLRLRVETLVQERNEVVFALVKAGIDAEGTTTLRQWVERAIELPCPDCRAGSREVVAVQSMKVVPEGFFIKHEEPDK